MLAPERAGTALLVQATIPHDIGYSEPALETGFHALDGARYLRSLRLDDLMVNLVAHHSCAAFVGCERALDKALAEFPSGCLPMMAAQFPRTSRPMRRTTPFAP